MPREATNRHSVKKYTVQIAYGIDVSMTDLNPKPFSPPFPPQGGRRVRVFAAQRVGGMGYWFLSHAKGYHNQQ